MAQEPNEGWQKGRSGHSMERSGLTPFGSRFKEIVSPTLQKKYRRENFRDAQRVLVEHAPTDDQQLEDVRELFSVGLGIAPRSRVEFMGDNDSLSRIEQIGQGRLEVLLGRETRHQVEQGVPLTPGNSYAALEYREDRLDTCRLQAESPRDLYREAEKVTDWRESLPTYLNYLKTSDKDELRKLAGSSTAVLEEATEDATRELGEEAVEAVYDIARSIVFTKLLTAIPADDRQDAYNIIEERELAASVTLAILQAARDEGAQTAEWVGDMVGEMEEDTFIQTAMQRDFNHWTMEQNAPSSRQVLDITSFDENSFSWKAVDIDLEERQPVERQMHAAESHYGQEVRIADNTFVVERDRDTMSVVCINAQGMKRWQAAFPLTAPNSEILNIYHDTKADFREIKRLLPATVQLEAKKPADENSAPAKVEVARYTLEDGIREIDQIYERVQGSDKIIHLKERAQAKREDWGRTGDSDQLARSETTVSPEQIARLRERIATVRQMVNEQGDWYESPKNPDHEEGVLHDDDFHVTVEDVQQGLESTGTTLQDISLHFGNDDEHDFTLDFSVDSASGYSLYVNFDRDTKIRKYNSQREATLDIMPVNEYRIMAAFLDEFITRQGN